jgi:hypothetical protein
MISFFIGTLFNGEAEFEEHTNAIKTQVNVNYKHHVIKNLSEYKAHQQLFLDWEKNSVNFDFFVKIDADTILNRSNALVEIASLFDDPQVTAAQIRLLDYFSNSLIPGLNTFSPKVKFRRKAKRLFPDIVDYNHLKVLKVKETQSLEPIGYHCLNPNQRQSFYYGYHRMLKDQHNILKLVANEWIAHQDESRLWALFGAQAAERSMLPKSLFSSNFIERAYHHQINLITPKFEKFVNRVLNHG